MKCVYKIVNKLNGDCYVGSSINFRQRHNRHLKDLKNGEHHSIILQRAWDKYGSENFEIIVLQKVIKSEELLDTEQRYIDELKPKYNICETAYSPLGRKDSEETKMKKRKYAIENNVKPPESTWKDRSKSVLMLDYNTKEVLQEFESMSEACRFIGKDATFASTISSCCENKRFSAFGYRWVYCEEDIPNLRDLKKKKAWNKGIKYKNPKVAKSVAQYTLDGEFVKIWSSVKAAEEVVGKGVGNCARGISKTSNGFIWKFN